MKDHRRSITDFLLVALPCHQACLLLALACLWGWAGSASWAGETGWGPPVSEADGRTASVPGAELLGISVTYNRTSTTIINRGAGLVTVSLTYRVSGGYVRRVKLVDTGPEAPSPDENRTCIIEPGKSVTFASYYPNNIKFQQVRVESVTERAKKGAPKTPKDAEKSPRTSTNQGRVAPPGGSTIEDTLKNQREFEKKFTDRVKELTQDAKIDISGDVSDLKTKLQAGGANLDKSERADIGKGIDDAIAALDDSLALDTKPGPGRGDYVQEGGGGSPDTSQAKNPTVADPSYLPRVIEFSKKRNLDLRAIELERHEYPEIPYPDDLVGADGQAIRNPFAIESGDALSENAAGERSGTSEPSFGERFRGRMDQMVRAVQEGKHLAMSGVAEFTQDQVDGAKSEIQGGVLKGGPEGLVEAIDGEVDRSFKERISDWVKGKVKDKVTDPIKGLIEDKTGIKNFPLNPSEAWYRGTEEATAISEYKRPLSQLTPDERKNVENFTVIYGGERPKTIPQWVGQMARQVGSSLLYFTGPDEQDTP